MSRRAVVKQDSLLENGFSAATLKDERRCQTQVADVLVSTENVTATVTKAVAGSPTRPPTMRASAH